MTDPLVKPLAPWELPHGPMPERGPCAACKDTGKIQTSAGVFSCGMCVDQRAIDAAAASREVMDRPTAKELTAMELAKQRVQVGGKTLSEAEAIEATALVRHAWSVEGGALLNQNFPNEVPVVTLPVASLMPQSTANILEMSAAKYHTDPIDPDVPSLSNSIAKTIIIDCAYMAWLAHPRLGNCPTPPTKAMELGVLRHAATLENGRGIVCLPFENWRTKDSKTARDDARANGQIPMLAHDYEPLMAVGEDVRYALADAGMELRGKSEVIVTWYEQSKLGPVLCRAMMDHLIIDQNTAEIIDLKFISKADVKTCTRHIWDLGYDMQASFYTSAIEQLYPHLAGRIRFRFAFCQVMSARSPRRAIVTPIELNGEFKVLGRERSQRAIETWARCLKNDQWPGYVPDGYTERVAPAPWMLTGEMDQQRADGANEDSEPDEDSDDDSDE